MPRMYTLEFTRMPAGRPGDALAADVTNSCTVRVLLGLWDPDQRSLTGSRQAHHHKAGAPPLLRRTDKPLCVGMLQICIWVVAVSAHERARMHMNLGVLLHLLQTS